ncbi:hypothetical protein EVAR_103991_1 [Eumeta japonica]|uniref:Uncharacterized protein n=1 Tax=Eumeta variegata TaxID=151549 RepID=A0A4C1XVR7_EUMVA|nr:hypothetical protein EVAR_103991_1 [Eumeta japonica]
MTVPLRQVSRGTALRRPGPVLECVQGAASARAASNARRELAARAVGAHRVAATALPQIDSPFCVRD